MIKISKRFALLGEEFFSNVTPEPITDGKLVHLNKELLTRLGLAAMNKQQLIDLLTGKEIVEAYSPLASCYAGHQFGIPVPALGDGRAILLAEHKAPSSEIWELQLKGAGKTAYSRQGDGRAVLRSTIREYLCSHAMKSLAIPTTEALAMASSLTPVYREQVETAATVLRVAPSFIRFGHFEFFAKRKKMAELWKLAKFVGSHYFRDLDINSADFIPNFLERVVRLTAETIAYWQSVGFVHGVMNSDNMSILGLTLDYGPFAFLDAFAPNQVFNHSDSEGRYVYAKQPYIAWWNLYRLAEALAVIYPDADSLESNLAKFAEYYNTKYQHLMALKLGFSNLNEKRSQLLNELLSILQKDNIDWTFFWRKLSYGLDGFTTLQAKFPSLDLAKWHSRFLAEHEHLESAMLQMQAVNPAIVLRSHLLEHAILKADQKDYTEIENLFEALANPFTEAQKFNHYYQHAPEWAKDIHLSCSS